MVRKLVMMAMALLLMPALASAQSTVTATATVADHIALTGAGNVAFGTLSRSSDNVVDATSGAVVRTLEHNRNVTVSFTNVPANLTAAGGSLSLPVALTCAWRVGAGSWSSAAACGSAQFDIDVGPSLTTSTLGFGGTITAANVASAIAGSYTGQFDILVVAR